MEVVHTSSNQIVANYDNAYYDVQITNLNDQWLVSVSGKAAKMGETIRNTLQQRKKKTLLQRYFVLSLRESSDSFLDKTYLCATGVIETAPEISIFLTPDG